MQLKVKKIQKDAVLNGCSFKKMHIWIETTEKYHRLLSTAPEILNPWTASKSLDSPYGPEHLFVSLGIMLTKLRGRNCDKHGGDIFWQV